MSDRKYQNRTDAGRQLAEAVAELDLEDPIVLGLPRGGVPVARQVADRLDAPLDVVVVRKIGAPANPEYAIGAIGEGDVEVLDADTMQRLGLDRNDLARTIAEERTELQRRLERYRGGRVGVEVTGRTIVLVDDGIATGRTAAAAAEVLRARGAARVVLAVPVGPPRSVRELEQQFDDVVMLQTPRGFMAVGSWYRDFGQTSDEEVVEHLEAHGRRAADRSNGSQGEG